MVAAILSNLFFSPGIFGTLLLKLPTLPWRPLTNLRLTHVIFQAGFLITSDCFSLRTNKKTVSIISDIGNAIFLNRNAKITLTATFIFSQTASLFLHLPSCAAL